ncbi:MAG: hypothetical protein H7282_12860 [Cytophagaceae bacterium]|nr:hypothetical protein [Cytophagaceae bacterium]
MKTITLFLLIILLSSYSYKITCDTSTLYGKWLLVDTYDEGDVDIDTLVNMKIFSHTGASITYLRGDMLKNDNGNYTTTEYYTLDRGKCLIQCIGLTSLVQRFFYIKHLDDQYLIGLERGKIYFYEKEE